jgi:hydrogenase nickel incorporation protein HypB
MAKKIPLNEPVLRAHDRIAGENRARFREAGLAVINVMGSPGAGKTTLLAETLDALADTLPAGVIVGDLATDQDGRRLDGPGRQVVQVNTVTACHLSASMIAEALPALRLEALRLLFIENVGNLVCPSSFDLGEDVRAVLTSVPEGDDKPSKYPTMFLSADAVVVNKIDLAPHASYDMARAERDIRGLRPGASVLPLSCRTGEGVDEWLAWVRAVVSRATGERA